MEREREGEEGTSMEERQEREQVEKNVTKRREESKEGKTGKRKTKGENTSVLAETASPDSDPRQHALPWPS